MPRLMVLFNDLMTARTRRTDQGREIVEQEDTKFVDVLMQRVAVEFARLQEVRRQLVSLRRVAEAEVTPRAETQAAVAKLEAELPLIAGAIKDCECDFSAFVQSTHPPVPLLS